ncbi:hypothetical protein [Streptomyces sp. NPDC003077]|uniref:hypothetical protein n=1 Tax=Streptomyces sp. NPDC003077 TaxID=3154443 RepID=UPI0033A9EB1A
MSGGARKAAAAAPELAAWWVGLTALWLMLISTVEPLEWAVGGGAAVLGSFAARAARKAVRANARAEEGARW